jgi:phage terminase small subunit
MAGVKGRSGRPPDKPVFSDIAPGGDAPEFADPDDFLRRVMNDRDMPMKIRMDAAKILRVPAGAQGKVGKKEIIQNAAEAAVTGRFGVRQPPKLVTG